jgi:predicted SAM-dependent methyltransferase
MRRVNIGCGMTPTIGWENFDNSFSLKLSGYPFLASLLFKMKLVNSPQMDYIIFCQANRIGWADATKEIPLPDGSVDVLYSSHMLEHLDRKEAVLFLKEANRVLTSKGIIRVAVPDIEKLVQAYGEHKDADVFIESTCMCASRPHTLVQRIKTLLVGARHHQWMYDGRSLSKLLKNEGFSNPIVLKAGDTTISNPAPLDLYERWDDSVYVEAIKE